MKYHKYILICVNDEEWIEAESPKGYDENSISLVRSEKYFGVITEITVDYEFTGNGYDFIFQKYSTFGIDVHIKILVYEYGKFVTDGKLNFDGFKNNFRDKLFKIDILESSFIQLFHNRDRTKFNVLSGRNVDGKEVVPAALKTGTIRGQIINFISEFRLVNDEPEDNSLANLTRTLPLEPVSNEDPQVTLPFYVAPDPFTNDIPVGVENSIYYNDESINQTADFTIEYTIEEQVVFFGDVKGWSSILIERYNGSDIKQETLLEQHYLSNGTFSKNASFTVTFEPGDYLLAYVLNHSFVGGFGLCRFQSLKFTSNRDSIHPDSTSPVILYHDLFEALISQMTGKNFTLVSNVFGRTDLLDSEGNPRYAEDGRWAYLGVSHGTWLRGFSPYNLLTGLLEGELSTTFEEAWQSFEHEPLGMKIIGEKVYIDPISDLFTNEVIVDFGEVNELESSPLESLYFNEVEIGSEPIDIEAVNGLDEFNFKAGYVNDLKTYSEKLELVSKYQAAGQAIERARRLTKSSSGTEDSKYDNIIFKIMFNAPEEVGIPPVTFTVMQSERYLDNGIDFVDGIFSKETAINLRLCPSQSMSKWKSFLGIPLVHNSKTYTYQSKDFNSGLKITIDGNSTEEGVNVDIGTDYIAFPEERSFKLPVTQVLVDVLKENPYGLIQYKYGNYMLFDYIWNVDASKELNFKCLASRPIKISNVPIDYEKMAILKYSNQEGAYIKYSNEDKAYLKHGN